MWQDFSNAVRDMWQASEPSGGSYRADLHYMRGPGPKWHAKHAGFLTVAPLSARHSMNTSQRTPKPRRCPSCAQPMPLIRTTERFGDLPVLHTFACRTCDMVFAHEAEPGLS
jgi:hypothetical protein